MLVFPYWSCAAGAPPGVFGFGGGPWYFHRIFPFEASIATTPQLPRTYMVPASMGRFLFFPLTTIGEPWIPPE